jgi:hypothetical protein
VLPFLVLVPVGTSLILGVLYLLLGDGRPATKILGIIVFSSAVYLQFFSRYSLYGLLLQIVLAFCLACWQKVSRSA